MECPPGLFILNPKEPDIMAKKSLNYVRPATKAKDGSKGLLFHFNFSTGYYDVVFTTENEAKDFAEQAGADFTGKPLPPLPPLPRIEIGDVALMTQEPDGTPNADAADEAERNLKFLARTLERAGGRVMVNLGSYGYIPRGGNKWTSTDGGKVEVTFAGLVTLFGGPEYIDRLSYFDAEYCEESMLCKTRDQGEFEFARLAGDIS